ncbi:MAG: cytochrome c [Pyrinomonadaceae bacterium]
MGRKQKFAATLAALSLVCFGYVLSATRAAGLEEPQRRSSGNRSLSKSADSLFKQNCARCHGADGRGETAIGKIMNTPDMTDADWWQKRGNTPALVRTVTNGKGGMPAFKKKLTRQEINSLVSYVRRFKK